MEDNDTVLESIRASLEAETRDEVPEDFNAYESSGGNFDDAYAMGVEHGRAELAAELLGDYFKTES